MSELDTIDRRILELLQQDGRLTMTELGERVGLSTSPCSQRVKRLLDDGVITSINGKQLPIKVQSILLHGDTPGAVENARAIRHEIESGNGRIASVSRLV